MPAVRSLALLGWKNRDQSKGALRRRIPTSPPVERNENSNAKSWKPRSITSHPAPRDSPTPTISPSVTFHLAAPWACHPVRSLPLNRYVGVDADLAASCTGLRGVSEDSLSNDFGADSQ